jgi:TolA-binding protein
MSVRSGLTDGLSKIKFEIQNTKHYRARGNDGNKHLTFTTIMNKNEENIDTSHAQKVHQTQAQLDAIENEIRETQPLTSELRDMDVLKKLYESDASSKYFEMGTDYLSTIYGKMRNIRGDGNCYYRAFLYSLCESLINNKAEMDRVFKYGT